MHLLTMMKQGSSYSTEESDNSLEVVQAQINPILGLLCWALLRAKEIQQFREL
jgi:hypothetical protein